MEDTCALRWPRAEDDGGSHLAGQRECALRQDGNLWRQNMSSHLCHQSLPGKITSKAVCRL